MCTFIIFVVLNIQFGKMYTNIMSVLSWGVSDLSSGELIFYFPLLIHMLNLKRFVQMKLCAAIGLSRRDHLLCQNLAVMLFGSS
jgi:hypothetical protein